MMTLLHGYMMPPYDERGIGTPGQRKEIEVITELSEFLSDVVAICYAQQHPYSACGCIKHRISRDTYRQPIQA